MSAAVDVNSNDFNVLNTLEKVVLNYASLKDNSNKFYIIELQEGTGLHSYRVYTEYGRLGKSSRKNARYFNSHSLAINEYYNLLSEKEKKGYKQVEVVEESCNTQTSAMIRKPNKGLDLSSVGDKILRFIGKLYQTTTNFLISSIDTPIGKLSANQVIKGLSILDEIERELNVGDDGSLEYLSNEFYSIIPISFGNKVNYNEFIIDDYYKLNDKKDLLGVMDSVVNVQNNLESTLEEKYKALNVKLKSLSKRTNEYKRIVKKVQDTQGHNHHFNIKVKEVYVVEDMKGFDKFNPYEVSTIELFHGSRNQNILGILQSGLKIKPKSAVHTGSMFGSGIYFAGCSSKSANYCFGFGGGRDLSDENFMFLCDVATGKIKEYDSAQPHLTKAPYGYNSVKGVKGNSLVHDEYMVYNANQVKVKYIIEFESNY